jgi:predicted Zn-dependent protease
LHPPKSFCDLVPVHYSLFRFPARVVTFVPKLSTLHAHSRGGVSEAKLSIVQDVDSEADGLFFEVYNESFATKSAIVTCVHLDLRFALVVFFNDATFAESFDHFFERSVKGQTHEHGRVFGFSLRWWSSARACSFSALTALY